MAAAAPKDLLARQPTARRLLLVCAILLILVLAALLVALGSGSSRIPPGDVARILLVPFGVPLPEHIPTSQITIVHQVRLPRVAAGLLVGAGLAAAGVTMQAIFRNPLADPGILGIGTGGSLGAVLAISTGLATAGLWTLPLCAFAGSLAAALTVYLLSLKRGRTNVATLLLSGVALNACLGASISIMLLIADNFAELQGMLAWLVGGLAGRGWPHVIVMLAPVMLCIAALTVYTREMNLFLLGEETATGLGVNVPRVRFILIALSALLTGVVVSMAGAIGFVGLVVPHMLRVVIGPDHRVLLPASVLGGAAFLVLADTVTRSMALNQELPVGAVTGLIGGPFFLYLLWRSRRHVTGL